jgi:hypothetical protein
MKAVADLVVVDALKFDQHFFGNQRGDLLQLAQEVRWLDALGNEAIAPLEEENGKLKKIVADLSLDKAMLQDVIRRKF